MDYEQILVIVLSTFLVIAIALWIVLTIFLIKLVQSARGVVAKADTLADKAVALGEFFKNSTGSFAILRAISTVVETFTKKCNYNKGE
jgi:hypothetical protein